MTLLKEGIQSIISKIDRFSYYSRKQQFYRGNIIMLELCQDIADVIGIIFDNVQELNGDAPFFDIEGMYALLQQLQEAQENKDYVLLTDIYELQLLPVFVQMEERIMSALGVHIDVKLLKKNIMSCKNKNPQLLYSLLPEKVVSDVLQSEEEISDNSMNQLVDMVQQCANKGYVIELTSSGFYTIAVRKKEHTYYIHTNGNVVKEALILAEEWLVQEKEEYIFYGLGLGYAYCEMLSMDYNISIQVLETNRELLYLAMVFAPIWKLYDSNRFEIIYDPTGHKMQKISMRLQENTGFYVFYPALLGIKKLSLKQQMDTYYMEESSVRTHSRSLYGNFRSNQRIKAGNIQQIADVFFEKSVLIVAAGPSLDKNMEILKQKKDGMIILAVGTVLKKLLQAGIRPDYVIMIDANDTVYSQIQGIEDCQVPLLFLSTVFSLVPRNYQGEKYLLCQKGFAPAEALAEEKHWMLVESGGSVVTAALDLCLRLSVEKIIFVGLDLAFTDSLDHAVGTNYQAEIVQDTEIVVEAVDGGRIATGKNLKLYLDWIEKRIAGRTGNEENTMIIDATEGGARKKGMKVMSLREVMGGEG